jgi:hypothetical protein
MEPLRTLNQCLIDVGLVRLRIIARLWGLEVKATRPLEIAAELAQALGVPAHAADLWRSLPEDERAALTALLDAGGMMPTATFLRRFGEIRPIGPGRLERETPWRNPVGPAEGLWYRGIIFEGFAADARETYPVFFVPAELRAALPVESGTEGAHVQLEPAPPPTERFDPPDLLLDDLPTVLSFIHNKVVRPRDNTFTAWPEQQRRQLERALRKPDAQRLDFILHLIAHLGWTNIGDDGRLRLVAEPVIAWLQETVGASRALLVDAWLGMPDWNELWRLTDLQPDDTGTWRHDPTLARTVLLRYLGGLPRGGWVRIDDFVGAIKATDPDFQRPGGDYEAWYVRDGTSGAYLTGFESWDHVEGVLLRVLLSKPAWWLGLVDLGGTAQDEPFDVFRPSEEVDLIPDDLTLASLVRPDLTVALPAARRFERFQLARVADLVSADDPYVYRLTPASLERARRQRIGPEKVLNFLDGLSSAPLPEAVRSSLTRWDERGTEVWLERAVLLRVTDEAVMEHIIASPTAGRYVGRRIGPTVAAVSERDWPGLLDALVDLGLLAEVVGI